LLRSRDGVLVRGTVLVLVPFPWRSNVGIVHGIDSVQYVGEQMAQGALFILNE